MYLFVLFCAFIASDVTEATMSEENNTQPEILLQEEDNAETTNGKNPIQEWFENLGKNMSTNTQNTMNNINNWFTQLAQNNNGGQNLPTMYMGSFQLVKMPMPQISDVVKGMGDLATVVQTLNKLGGKK
nr:PREDICTED: uncharacterized protein LOC103313320 isoform X2 [Tribolium castaneum]|eukprot:XP_015836234.1 PREDICTED: uncharacterized protein LOC103313320 isoform X2 [Tribolium castaneum]